MINSEFLKFTEILAEFRLKTEKTVLQNLLKTLPIDVLSTTPLKSTHLNLNNLKQKRNNSLFVESKKKLKYCINRNKQFYIIKIYMNQKCE